MKKLAPPLIGSILFCLILLAMCSVAVHGAHHLFVYPLDDSYIHLALSKTLAFHHVWGINPDEFGSASSSPGWTLLLAGVDLVFGSHLVTPLLLNALCAIAVLFTIDFGLRTLRPDLSGRARIAAQMVIIFLMPLPNLAYIGMEHVAQTLTILLAVISAVRILAMEPDEPVPSGLSITLLVSILIGGALRYEAVFAVLPIALLLVLRRRIGLAALFCACAAVGPVAFGLYSHHLSGFWLPFSVVMKAQMEKESTEPKWTRFFSRNANGSFLQILLIPLFIWAIRLRNTRFWAPTQLVLLLSFLITGLHLILAPTRWLMRYESYFVALTIFAIFAALPRWQGLRQRLSDTLRTSGPTRVYVAALIFVSVWLSPFLLSRFVKGLTGGPESSVDRYHEHIQMARFVNQFYDHDTIVVNDIGAVAFYSDAHLIDLYGLGSIEPARLLKDHGQDLTLPYIRDWASSEHASIAILQTEPRWINQRIPHTWIHVADWRLPRNLMFGDKTVSFYALDTAELPRLCENIRQFRLDPDVRIIPVPGTCALNATAVTRNEPASSTPGTASASPTAP